MCNLSLGQAVSFQSKTGYIYKIQEQENQVFSLGGPGGMQREMYRVHVAWSDGRGVSEVPEGIAAPWADRAAHLPPISEADAVAMAETGKAAHLESLAKDKREREAAAVRLSEWQEEHASRIPADSVAVIVAELERDDSDSMTDYFAVSKTRSVVLAFSRHTRDNFQEMRKAARNFEETAPLADSGSDAEHREKYSMGRGYYLKAGRGYGSGWAIRKLSFYGAESPITKIPMGDWHAPATLDAKASPRPCSTTGDTDSAVSAGSVAISEHTHTKRGFQMFIVAGGPRVEREEFSRRLAKAKESGGWYSRKWGNTPAGFAFKDRAAAESFAAELEA